MNIIQPNAVVYQFHKSCNLQQWEMVNDAVMGGMSGGKLSLNTSGNGVFSGHVSIKNNGGFSSIQCRLNPIVVQDFNAFALRIKGDGSVFQLRIKHAQTDRHSFIYNFKTSGEWETVTIPLTKMTASFRGYQLNISNFNKTSFEQIGILKASKSEADFKLSIDSIALVKCK